MAATGKVAVLGTLVIAIVAMLGWQRTTARRLRYEVETLREGRAEMETLQQENRRLAAARLAPSRLEALRTDHLAVARLREEIDALKARAKAEPSISKPDATTRKEPSMSAATEEIVPSAHWTNAGLGSAAGAFETALWAAAGGDIDTLASTLVFDPAARTRADDLWRSLPESARLQYRSPEHLIALFTARDVPQGGARIAVFSPGSHEMRFVAELEETTGRRKIAQFTAREENQSWRIVVPEKAVEKYSAQLRGASAPAAK